MKHLTEHISFFFELNSEETDIFLSRFSKINFKKGDIFLETGTFCNKIGLIEKGLMKCVYHKDGNEVIFEFAYENSFISDYYSFVTNTPSEKEISCLEDCTVYVITKDTLEHLGSIHPFIADMSRKVNEGLFVRMHNRLKSFLLDSPTQRYQQLIAERQDLAQRIPQYLIASYLNVQPETISRIRKKITSTKLS